MVFIVDIQPVLEEKIDFFITTDLFTYVDFHLSYIQKVGSHLKGNNSSPLQGSIG
jgi:hypothetical protein